MALIDHWVLGCAGNRELTNLEKIRARLRMLFGEIERPAEGQMARASGPESIRGWSSVVGRDLFRGRAGL